MRILKATKKQGFIPSQENSAFEKKPSLLRGKPMVLLFMIELNFSDDIAKVRTTAKTKTTKENTHNNHVTNIY